MAKMLKESEVLQNIWYEFDDDEILWMVNDEDVSFDEMIKAIDDGEEIESIEFQIDNDIVVEFDDMEEFEFTDLTVSIEYSERRKGWEITGNCFADNYDDFSEYEELENYQSLVEDLMNDESVIALIDRDDIYAECDYCEVSKNTYKTVKEALQNINSIIRVLFDRVNYKAHLCSAIRGIIENEEE